MYTLFILIEILIGILLIIVVLMQASKGGGLAGSFGGGNIGTVFGVRRTSDFLSKATTTLATVFMVLALFINLVVLPRGERQEQSVIQSQAPAQGALPPSTQPALPPQPQP
ncbi:MAG: preprotein translocase subunit SecG [Ignavibacterium sp.]|jgi:preprotein translocase subunit SecG